MNVGEKNMKSRLLRAIIGFSVLFMSVSVNAALISKLGGQVVYDTDLDITWLADANLAASNTFGVAGIDTDGAMFWDTAGSWIAAMNNDSGVGYLGLNNWRLPTTDTSVLCGGFNCTGSEMGHLFYNEFAATAGETVLATGDPLALAKFSNIQPQAYWSGTESADQIGVWIFNNFSGSQGIDPKNEFAQYAWAVHDGDVAAIPVPAAVWLFGSGLIGLLGVARRATA